MIDVDRLAMAALRGVVQELEGNHEGAGEILARLLSRPDASGTIARSVAPVAHRDVKPAKNTERPAPKQRAKRSRPAPAAATPPPDDEPEAAELVRTIEATHGLDAACTRFGFGSAFVMKRWAAGAPCSPRSIERLRVAAATEPYSARRAAEPKGQAVDAAPPEAALHEPDTAA